MRKLCSKNVVNAVNFRRHFHSFAIFRGRSWLNIVESFSFSFMLKSNEFLCHIYRNSFDNENYFRDSKKCTHRTIKENLLTFREKRSEKTCLRRQECKKFTSKPYHVMEWKQFIFAVAETQSLKLAQLFFFFQFGN